MSPNQMFLCGLSSEQMKKLGYRFYLDYVPDDEQSLLVSLNSAGFAFYGNIPVGERKEGIYRMTFTCSMMDERFS